MGFTWSSMADISCSRGSERGKGLVMMYCAIVGNICKEQGGWERGKGVRNDGMIKSVDQVCRSWVEHAVSQIFA